MPGGAMLPRSLEELCERLGIPVPSTEEDISAAVDQGIQLLKTDSISGYTAVYRVSSSDNPWQAKPYIRPKVQRSLGSFDTKEMAAAAVLYWAIGMLDSPLTPDKQRSKRHDGRRERDRSKGVQPLALFSLELFVSRHVLESRAHRCFACESIWAHQDEGQAKAGQAGQAGTRACA